ncbi:isochorismatase family protein [Thermodesulforhabdus norvegica]|uniref:Nicotinamidase-related amidase n=1 Tax=Thermodesulforhabdus norvegica TaxID=39841 RepID=A0A1I4RMD1_9BACT|nr:isochorismatase family protein [Thermodesulforhabdus norvegica]SFM53401.1 Nicotinamidase-related amidase [Thermodesulforhabdus norvegica]
MEQAREFLKRDDCLLLLVDVQKTLLDPCVRQEQVVKNCHALIEICQILDIPIVFTTHNAEKLGPFLPELVERVANPTILNKLEFSCFENDSIRSAVEQLGRRTLLLAGMESHICVFHTGAHALRLGYRVDLATDAVTSRSEENRLIGIKRLQQAGAIMSSTEMIIFELLNRAGTEEFRKALPLLKKL